MLAFNQNPAKYHKIRYHMPQKTNLVYFLCGIINLGYCYESGKVAWAVGAVKKNPNCIFDDPLNFKCISHFPSDYLAFSSKRHRRPPMGCPTSGGTLLVDTTSPGTSFLTRSFVVKD